MKFPFKGFLARADEKDSFAPSSKFYHQWWTWDTSVHESKGQPRRMQRALTQRIDLVEISKKGLATVRGTHGDLYQTSLQTCSCPDFEERGLPCKHMYALAARCTGFDLASFVHRSEVLPHPLRGYMNMGTYKVRGTNPETGRLNTKTVHAVDEAGAVREAAALGLTEPFSAEETTFPDAPDEMRAELAAAGVYVPEGAKLDDYQAASWRDRDGDDTTITREQWEYAASCGIKLSALAGETFAKEVFRNNHKRWKKA